MAPVGRGIPAGPGQRGHLQCSREELQLRVCVGARVFTRDGACAGYVDRLVADPANGTITDIVVFRDGGGLEHEIVAPISCVEASTPSEVVLTVTLLEADSFPDYVEGDYVSPTFTWPLGEGLVPANVLFPVQRLTQPASSREGLAVGMGVEALDGPIGIVEEVRLDPSTSDPTSFVLRGLDNLSERFIVPVDWIQGIRGRWVVLDCNAAQVHELSEPAQAA